MQMEGASESSKWSNLKAVKPLPSLIIELHESSCSFRVERTYVARNQYQSAGAATPLPLLRVQGRQKCVPQVLRILLLLSTSNLKIPATLRPLWRPVNIIHSLQIHHVFAPNHAIKACEEIARSAFKGQEAATQRRGIAQFRFGQRKHKEKPFFSGRNLHEQKR